MQLLWFHSYNVERGYLNSNFWAAKCYLCDYVRGGVAQIGAYFWTVNCPIDTPDAHHSLIRVNLQLLKETFSIRIYCSAAVIQNHENCQHLAKFLARGNLDFAIHPR
jgi:hypothetical protein